MAGRRQSNLKPAKPDKRPLALSPESLAWLFTKLDVMERAGLPADQAFAMLSQSEPALKAPLAAVQGYLSRGQPVSAAGYRAGLFTAMQQAIVRAGEASGTLADIYRQLAEHYSALASRIKKVKSKLYLPVFIFILAVFLQPLPALVKSEISLNDYLFSTAGRLSVIFGSVYFVFKLPKLFQSFGLAELFDRSLLAIPGVSGWIVKRAVNEFFFMLALMLQAGIAFNDALPKAVESIKNTAVQRFFEPALKGTDQGASVHETLSRVPLIDAKALQIVKSGEFAGRLPSALMQFNRLEAETIAMQNETLAEWLPRLVYLVISVWMAYSILGSHLASPVPAGL